VVRAGAGQTADSLAPYADALYADGLFKLAWFEALKKAASLRFVPLSVLNPRKCDFVYPEVAGKRAPYGWGGWIPDFQYRHLPHMFTVRQIETFEKVYGAVARRAPVVVLSSRMAEQDLRSYYPEAASRSVVMNFVSYVEPEWFEQDPKETQKKYGLPDRFFLVSNQFWRHKDHNTVIEALGLLKEKGERPVVACTGSVDGRDVAYFEGITARIRELGLEEQIRILGFLPRIDQLQLMRRSLAVIQPSLFEGWSTVVEDARSLAKPILLSDFPVHVEQDPPDGYYFARGNHEELATLIMKVFPVLEPGPHIDRESRARQSNVERLMEYGRHFLRIVRGALR
jgi:glycosyltransferase involved in cell wall biosynthesis